MSAWKSQLSWLVKGAANTNASLEAYGHGLRALQEKVARIDADLQSQRSNGDASSAELARLQVEITALKSQLRAAVDDLGDRIGSVVEETG